MTLQIEKVKRQILNAEMDPFKIYDEISNAIQVDLETSEKVAASFIANAYMNYPSDIARQLYEIEFRINQGL